VVRRSDNLPPSSPGLISFYKRFNRAVILFLNVFGKNTGRQLPHPQMILQAFAADTFFTARFIGESTVGKVFL